jgi:hypothetical protein
MNRKTKGKVSADGTNKELPANTESFEEFDPTQAPEIAAESHLAFEAFGGLAATEDDASSVSQAREEIEKRYMIAIDQKLMAVAADGPYGMGNIIGVGIGEKEVDGFPTGQLAVKVFVKEKLNLHEIAAEAAIPASLGGIDTDVVVSGEVGVHSYTSKVRPAPGGVSVGNCNRIMAGTLGCLVKRGNQLFLLSNNHVLALVNTSPLGTGNPQPGRLDGGICESDVIARLHQFVPISFSGQCNTVDAAIAKTSPHLVDRRIIRPGGIRQSLVAPDVPGALNMMVQKSGRTTQYRRGLINAIHVTADVNYAPLGGIARFCRQISVRGFNGIFSDRGDSGSLVTNFPQNNPVALLFAGNASANVTFCTPIRTVLGAFGVTIVY